MQPVVAKAKVERETEPPLKAPSIVWKRLWQPPTARAPRPHMERQLGLFSSGKTGVPEECVLVCCPGLFDFSSTPFNCHFLDGEMDDQWVKSDRSSVSTASHHPLTHFWTKLTYYWTKLTHRTLWPKCPDRKSSHWPCFSCDLELFISSPQMHVKHLDADEMRGKADI